MADDRQVNITIKSTYEGKGTVDAKKGLKNVEQQAQKTTQSIASGSEEASKKIVTISSALNIVKSAWQGISGIVSWFAESVSMANKNARAVNMLAAAYKNVGYTAPGAVDAAKKFATEMQNLTGIADEAFLDGQRLLANYGVVGAKAQEAIRAAYALSVSQGMSFESSLMQIAKAAAGSTAALSRYGIILGDGVKEGEKFDAVLKQINDKFGASAQASMGDMSAQVNALKENWGDFREEIGRELIPALQELIKWGNSAIGVLRQIGDFMAWTTGKNTMPGLSADEMAYQKTLKEIEETKKHILKLQAAYNDAPLQSSKAYYKEQQEKDFKALERLERRKKLFEEMHQQGLINEKEQKAIAEQQADQIEKNRQALAGKADAAKEEKAKQKEITKELERQQQVLDNMGLSSSKDLKGWSRDKQSSEQGPSELEVVAGGSSQLGNAENAWATVEAEREAINWLYLEKKALIDQEITDEELKQEALTNLENQYNQQKLINDKNQAKARQQVYASMWSSLSSLATNENKKVAAVGKVASIAQATMSTLTGAAKALELPFPANLAAMAAVLAQGFALVGQIQSVKLADGGLVKAVTGGVPAVVGEGGSDEAVLPLDNARAMQRIGGAIAEQSGQMGPTVNVYVQTQATGGVEAILEQLTEASRNGVVQALEFANLNYKVGSQQQGYSV